jgi:hypothetical protein
VGKQGGDAETLRHLARFAVHDDLHS